MTSSSPNSLSPKEPKRTRQDSPSNQNSMINLLKKTVPQQTSLSNPSSDGEPESPTLTVALPTKNELLTQLSLGSVTQTVRFGTTTATVTVSRSLGDDIFTWLSRLIPTLMALQEFCIIMLSIVPCGRSWQILVDPLDHKLYEGFLTCAHTSAQPLDIIWVPEIKNWDASCLNCTEILSSLSSTRTVLKMNQSLKIFGMNPQKIRELSGTLTPHLQRLFNMEGHQILGLKKRLNGEAQ